MSHHATGGGALCDMKFGTVMLCNVRKMVENFFLKIAAIGMMTSLIMSRKMAKICFLSKINLATARKKIFKVFFQLLIVKITCKLNIYRLIC